MAEPFMSALECWMCGTAQGLRQVHDGGGYTSPEYSCASCYVDPSTDEVAGPAFDDLPEATS